MILEKQLTKKGIIPPEYIGSERGLYNTLRNDLKERGVQITENKSIIT
jgi:hypothetical protein